MTTVTTGDLARILAEHPGDADAAVLHTQTDAVTLAELRAAVATLATQLSAAGVEPGMSVACLADDGFGTITAAFAAWTAGAVFVPLNARLTDPEIASALFATTPAAVVTRQAERVAIETPMLLRTGRLTWKTSGNRCSHAPTRYDDDAALVMRTSGTTGAPKSVVLRHTGIVAGIDTVANQLRSKSQASGRPPMPNLIPTSLALWAGLWNTLFGLRVGAPVIMLDSFNTSAYAELVKRFEIRSTVLAPAMMTMLTNDESITDLAPLRSVRSITAPLTPVQARSFHAKFGVAVMNSYGQTELGGEVVGWTAADTREYGETKLGAVGRAHPGVVLKVVDESFTESAVDQVGEVWISSPYPSQADESLQERLRDGFLQTGDLGRVDAEGFLWLDGRIADLINRGGMKVVPQEVEEAFRTLPGVADVCVAGVPDDRLGEVPVAWVIRLPGVVLSGADLINATRATLSAYKIPVTVRFVEEFPRSEIGKVLRRDLVKEYQP